MGCLNKSISANKDFNVYACIIPIISIPLFTECYVIGECQFSDAVSASLTIGASGCHRFCNKTPNCHWFTYHRDSGVCVAYFNCVTLSQDDCPECISGSSDCAVLENQCWMRGICKGSLIEVVLNLYFCSSSVDCATVKGSSKRYLIKNGQFN